MELMSSPAQLYASQRRSNAAPKTPTTPDILHSTEYKPRLHDEIAILMRAHGDASEQCRNAINLVEKIVIQQLRGILSEVMNVAFRRSGNVIPSQADFESLFRNQSKARRFRKYIKTANSLKVAEIKQSAVNNINFLNRLAEDNRSDEEDEEVYDAEKMRRLFRADRISQVLNPQKYEDFQRARTWSSNFRNKADMIRKLTEILQIPKDVQENSNCLEIILFLTQETIATVVDYAILTRLNSDNHITEPFTVSSSITHNMLHLCPETHGRGMEGIKAITVQEINEALRRVQEMSTKRMGTSFRSDSKIPFLAL